MGETWDPATLGQAAAAEAEEARYLFQSKDYLQGGIVVRAPNADLSRDPRWGRSEESYGEDAFLTVTMTVAFVKGLQGEDPKYWRTASLLKHFMANGNEDGRGGSSSNFDERLLREYYSVPFRMGIEEGGAQAFMTAYNAVNRIAGWEKCPLAGEGKEAVDRKSITLEQEELIKQVFAGNPRTVVVLRASFPYAINWTQEHVPAILHTTNSSQEEGNALADVLFGDYNPGGKLVDTWPKSLDQLPPIMDYDLRLGRTYMYFKGAPLYPFGFGLSYTTFKYANAKVSAQKLPSNGQIAVSVDITNSGTREGDEVVQLYYPAGAEDFRGRGELERERVMAPQAGKQCGAIVDRF